MEKEEKKKVEEPAAAVTPLGPLWPAGTALLLGQPNSAAFSYLRHKETTPPVLAKVTLTKLMWFANPTVQRANFNKPV